MRGAWTLGSVRGIPIRIHFSLPLALPLLAIAFSRPFASIADRQRTTLSPVVWGLAIALVLFASVLVHELAHSLLARRVGARVKGITLLFIGGVSELAGDPPRPRHEALVAVAGPLVSLLLGAMFVGIAQAVAAPPDVRGALLLAGILNLALGAFNLIPAFPMDGGRILRALLTPRFGRVRATNAAAGVGKVFALLLFLVGIWAQDFIAMLIAAFVFFVGGREAAGVVLDAEIARIRVGELVVRERPLAIPAWFSVIDAAERMRAARVDVALVVTGAGRPLGALGIADLRRVPAPARRTVRLEQIVQADAAEVDAREPANRALRRLAETGATALPVVDGQGEILGLFRVGDVDREVSLRNLDRAGRPEPTEAEPVTRT